MGDVPSTNISFNTLLGSKPSRKTTRCSSGWQLAFAEHAKCLESLGNPRIQKHLREDMRGNFLLLQVKLTSSFSSVGASHN